MRDQSYIMAVAPSTTGGASSPTVMQPSSPSDYASGGSPHCVSADHSMPRLICILFVVVGNLVCRTVFVYSVIWHCSRFEGFSFGLYRLESGLSHFCAYIHFVQKLFDLQ